MNTSTNKKEKKISPPFPLTLSLPLSQLPPNPSSNFLEASRLWELKENPSLDDLTWLAERYISGKRVSMYAVCGDYTSE
jgi:hypothetical protein